MKSKLSITSFIRLAVLASLILWAAIIVKSFIGVLSWAIILAVAINPFYQKLVAKIGSKRKKIVTVFFTLITVALIAVPSYHIFSSVLESATETIGQIRNGTLHIAPPKQEVKKWPMGEKIYSNWESASKDIKTYATTHKKFILEKGKGIFSSMLGIMGTLFLFILSLIIAIILMYNANSRYQSLVKFANKLIGKDGESIVIMSRNTVRSVVKGILFVAILQAVLSFIGFKLIGLPGAGIFTIIILIAAIVQLPVTLAVVPAIAMVFFISDNTTHNILFTVYILAVSLVDNFLKPILLSKGLETPTIIIFLGAIGGVMLHGIIGLFVGTVVLALAHRFYSLWVNSTEEG